MLPQLTLDNLVHSAYDFCEQQNGLNHVESTCTVARHL